MVCLDCGKKLEKHERRQAGGRYCVECRRKRRAYTRQDPAQPTRPAKPDPEPGRSGSHYTLEDVEDWS